MFESFFAVHGVSLVFSTNNSVINSAVTEFLDWFRADEGPPAPDLSIMIKAAGAAESPPLMSLEGGESLYSSKDPSRLDFTAFGLKTIDLSCSADGLSFLINLGGDGQIMFVPGRGEASGWLRSPETMDPNVIAHFLFILVLAELLKARGLFPIHCSAVSWDGRGIIFPGHSGAGKTTICLALVRDGFGFLGDDRPLLRREGGGLRLLAFPESVDVTPATAGFFPELAGFDGFIPNRNRRKKSFFIDRLYPGSIRASCEPAAIVYPVIEPGCAGRLEPLPRIDALRLLMPHSVLVLNREATRAQFDLIHALVEKSSCFKLYVGGDPRELPGVIREALA